MNPRYQPSHCPRPRFATSGASTTVLFSPNPVVSSPTNGSQPSGPCGSCDSRVRSRRDDVERNSPSLFVLGWIRPNSRVTLTSVMTKMPHVVVRTGQNTGRAAQTAARWISREARPPVVALYQLGSNWNVPSLERWMIKTMRRIAHETVLPRLSVPSPTGGYKGEKGEL